MDCRSCGIVNAPSRRYCRECGARLGQPCTVCHFFNAVEDKHCGGCGRRLKSPASPLAGQDASAPIYAAAAADEMDFSAMSGRIPPPMPADPDIAGQGVSQSEIDGLFENILDEEPGEPTEGDA